MFPRLCRAALNSFVIPSLAQQLKTSARCALHLSPDGVIIAYVTWWESMSDHAKDEIGQSVPTAKHSSFTGKRNTAKKKSDYRKV